MAEVRLKQRLLRNKSTEPKAGSTVFHLERGTLKLGTSRMSQRKKQIRQKFRDAVFARDGFTCRRCGFASTPERAEEELDAHHITDRNEMPHGGYVAENGISLCDDCHAKAEAFHCGEPVLPGFLPADLYALIGSSGEEARTAAERLAEE
jgi:5-methylcytosine-specific restriction endonuclease McrA